MRTDVTTLCTYKYGFLRLGHFIRLLYVVNGYKPTLWMCMHTTTITDIESTTFDHDCHNEQEFTYT